VLLLLAGKIEWSAEKSAWFKAIDEAGVAAKAWPVQRNELPGWIGKRLRIAGFTADAGAIALLAERVEGNLLAAQQEIEKLRLLAEPGALDARTLATLVADSARYSSFDLCDRALEGDRAAAIRTLQGLRAEGEEIQMVLGALAAEIRRLMRVAERHADGEPMDQAIRAERGRAHYGSAIRRLGARGMHELLRRAALVDRCIKGLETQDAWTELLGLVIQAAGGIGKASNLRPR
jgi:DNA polymerase-3 subunit delta